MPINQNTQQKKDFKLDDSYVTVAERIVEFRNKYPEGSLQPWNPAEPYRVELINGNQCFIVVAAAYRAPDDTRPGIGMAYEPIPGTTPYTRGSELQNAETAAWGRAIVAVLAADTKKGIATMEEVRVASERNTTPTEAPMSTPDLHEQFSGWYDAIRERQSDYEGLLALYNEAVGAKIPAPVIADIKAAGQKVSPRK